MRWVGGVGREALERRRRWVGGIGRVSLWAGTSMGAGALSDAPEDYSVMNTLEVEGMR